MTDQTPPTQQITTEDLITIMREYHEHQSSSDMCIDNDCEGIKNYALLYVDHLSRLRAVEEVMEKIKNHMEFVSPTGFQTSSVWIMADKALFPETKK